MMELTSKPGYEKTLQRYEAWWHCEIVDRPPISMTVPSGKKVKWPQKQHATQRDRWMDLDFVLAQHAASVESRKWIADSY